MAVESGGVRRPSNLAGDVFAAVVNGEPVVLQTHPARPLVDILRGPLGLTGVKIGCGIGRCGACAVLVDGKLTNSCLLMAYQAQGKSITTVEGLSDTRSADVPGALVESGAVQCGYCSPGMAMAIAALLQSSEHPSGHPNGRPSEHPSGHPDGRPIIDRPTREQAAEALSGNLCRCTGYAPMLRAIEALFDARRPRRKP